MNYHVLTADAVLKFGMSRMFDHMDMAGCFKKPERLSTPYDKAVAAQKASKLASENKP